MKIALVLFFLLIASLTFSPCAYALSTESGSVNSDGSAKYTDPDEQKPGFMVYQDTTSTNGVSFSGSPSVSMPTLGDNSQGAHAFDQAFSRQQNR